MLKAEGKEEQEYLTGCEPVAAELFLNGILDRTKPKRKKELKRDFDRAIEAMKSLCEVYPNDEDKYIREMQCAAIADVVLAEHNLEFVPEEGTCQRMMTLGDYIAEGRGELSRRAAAKKIGCSYTFLELVEKNRKTPSEELLKTICDVFKLDPNRSLELAGQVRVDRIMQKQGVASRPKIATYIHQKYGSSDNEPTYAS